MLTGEPTVAVAVTARGSSVSAGSGTLTLATTEPTVTGRLTITLEPDTITAAGHIGDTLEPPGLAESLLIIFARRTTRTKDIDALVGDFAERFERDCASGMSRPRAVRLYWAHVVSSIWPQIWQAIQRVGWLGLIAEFLRRWF
jgi:hypothetical protein